MPDSWTDGQTNVWTEIPDQKNNPQYRAGYIINKAYSNLLRNISSPNRASSFHQCLSVNLHLHPHNTPNNQSLIMTGRRCRGTAEKV